MRVSFILLTLPVAYALIVVAMYLLQDRLIYYPSVPGRQLDADPARIGLEFEDVELRTEDGVRLHAWWIPHPEPRGGLIFFHGNAGNISHRLYTLAMLHRVGVAVLIIDYRGFGLSEGQPSERGTYLDAEAAWRHLRDVRDLSPDEIVLFGRSLGTGVASWLADRHTPAGLVLESPFTSLPALAELHYRWLPVRLLARHRYDTLARIGRLECPVLVIHSVDDTLIPIAQGRAVYEAAPEPKRFLETRGNHNAGADGNEPGYSVAWSEFLGEVLSERAQRPESATAPGTRPSR